MTYDLSSPYYCTTYCNKAHRLDNGKPIGHECYILPHQALAAERAGNFERAIELIETARRMGKLRVHRGTKIPSDLA